MYLWWDLCLISILNLRYSISVWLMQLNGRPIVINSFVFFLFLVCVCFFVFSVFLYSSFSHSLFEFSFRCACRFDCSRIDQGFLYSLLVTRYSLLVTRYVLSVLLFSCSRSLSFSVARLLLFQVHWSDLYVEPPWALSLPMRRVPFVTITLTFCA